MRLLKTNVGQVGAWSLLSVAGEVDMASAQQLRGQLVELVSAGRVQVVVDCANIEFIDSTGLGVLVGALQRLRGSDGEPRLAAVGASMSRTLEITGLNRVFDVRATVEEATA